LIVDASALLAMLLKEADAERFAEAVAQARQCRIGAPTWVEAAMVIDPRGDREALAAFETFAKRYRLRVEPFTAEHAALARQAWRDYGRGSGHPAKLNFGDCLAYGFAKGEHEPLLFKGNDFVHTDIEPALRA